MTPPPVDSRSITTGRSGNRRPLKRKKHNTHYPGPGSSSSGSTNRTTVSPLRDGGCGRSLGGYKVDTSPVAAADQLPLSTGMILHDGWLALTRLGWRHGGRKALSSHLPGQFTLISSVSALKSASGLLSACSSYNLPHARRFAISFTWSTVLVARWTR